MLELFEKRLPLVIDKKIVGNYREQEDRCLTARKTREQVLVRHILYLVLTSFIIGN